ncbi:MAG: DNA mismatch repair protein MutS [Kiritimatiellae bacterium]|nr:DNA mismatch repair protein MutS [Kiritimatiellia bacterium]
MGEELTPMQRQYRAIKRELPPGAILMFRLGDFYEMFGEDAVVASPILGATLTQRAGQPMCGIPYHALDAYLAKLIRAGKTAALCDQMEDPRTVKKGAIVRREVTRIVTPGTVTEDGLLDADANCYIAAVSGLGLALLDLSTGEFAVEPFDSAEKLADALARHRPAELVLPRPDEEEAANRPDAAALQSAAKNTSYADAWTFSLDAAREELLRHFNVTALDGFGLEGRTDLVCAAGALLYYVHVTLRHAVDHVRSVRLRESADFLALDAGTIRHLALLPGDGVAGEASLLGVLNVARTPMGARRLAGWIRQPLRRAEAVNARLDAVEAFVRDRISLSALRERLGGVRDLERLIAKVDSGRANARDLRALAASLRPVADIRGELDSPRLAKDGTLLASIKDSLSPEGDVVALVDRAICEQPNVILTEGNLIAPGYSAELDELRQMAAAGHQWIAEYQTAEIARTGIKTLRVRRNSVFGFYIEISKAAAVAAPPEYERRQTLTNAERFTTPELREYERKVMGAQERSYALEADLFRDIVSKVALRTVPIQQTASAVGDLDAILSLADRALAAGYVRPVVDDSDVLEIADGRHPIIEQLPDAEPFVPNGTKLNGTTDQIMLITGPNMAGKSTYLRQVATIAIMAQAGSFVPASSMRLGALDRVFTRIGAGDDLARGRSTFLVEMQESANILNNATPRSLIVLDEIGRGTSTFDGISIAWSVAEYLHENPKVKAKTLFATHYHELTDLSEKFKGIKNYTVRVKEDGDRVVFLRRIAPGVAERSFGIHVAAMAGLPRAVVDRADQILKNLEANDLDVNAPKIVRRPRKKLSDLPGQMTLF